MNLASPLVQAHASIFEFLAARNAREKTLLAVAAIAGTLGLVYGVMIAPALTGRAPLYQAIPVLRQQVVQMRLLSKETAALSETPVVTLIAISKEAIETDLARNGLQAKSVMLTGNYAKVQFAAVSFGRVLNWLDEWQKSARVCVVDADIVALAQPDTVNANFTLQQFGNE